MADETLSVRKGTLGSTEMRFHELALQQWFYGTFFVRAGYPIPVVFGTPMDAFGNFQILFSRADSPFNYLFDLKDDAGNPLYEPSPSTLRYPLISILRKSWRLRPEMSYGLHQFRHMNWPTVSADVQRSDLATVATSFMPMGWDFRFQIDHFAMRPDTQAYFINMLFRALAVGGGTPQTWIRIHFPALGWQKVRLYMDGDLENSTKEEPEDQKHMEFRTTVNLVMEGYSIDQDIEFKPAFWKLIIRGSEESASPQEISAAFSSQFETTMDLRAEEKNPTLDARPNVPTDSQATTVMLEAKGTYAPSNIFLSGSNQPGAWNDFGQTSVDPDSPYFQGGIGPDAAFGTPTVTNV